MGTTGAVPGRHMGICGQYLDWLGDYDWIVECVGAMGYREMARLDWKRGVGL